MCRCGCASDGGADVRERRGAAQVYPTLGIQEAKVDVGPVGAELVAHRDVPGGGIGHADVCCDALDKIPTVRVGISRVLDKDGGAEGKPRGVRHGHNDGAGAVPSDGSHGAGGLRDVVKALAVVRQADAFPLGGLLAVFKVGIDQRLGLRHTHLAHGVLGNRGGGDQCSAACARASNTPQRKRLVRIEVN